MYKLLKQILKELQAIRRCLEPKEISINEKQLLSPEQVTRNAIKDVLFTKKSEDLMEYEVIKSGFMGGDVPQEVEVRFSLTYLGWCKLQKSQVWYSLMERVGHLQKIHNQK